MGRAMSLGLARPISVAAPIAHLHKEDVIKIGRDLHVPLELTLSCMNPAFGPPRFGAASPSDDRHCGRCSKCRERIHAFRDAGVPDPTTFSA